MKIKKKPHSAEYKLKVAIAALRGDKTTAELCQMYGIVSSQLFKWKKALIEGGAVIFNQKTTATESISVEIDKLHV